MCTFWSICVVVDCLSYLVIGLESVVVSISFFFFLFGSDLVMSMAFW